MKPPAHDFSQKYALLPAMSCISMLYPKSALTSAFSTNVQKKGDALRVVVCSFCLVNYFLVKYVFWSARHRIMLSLHVNIPSYISVGHYYKL